MKTRAHDPCIHRTARRGLLAPLVVAHLSSFLPLPVVLSGLLALAGCGSEDAPDAQGNFEATEVTVSAEVAGRLLRFTADEGARLRAGEVVAVVDTTSLVLQRRELSSQRRATGARREEVRRQVEVLRSQLETAREEHERDLRLLEADAATPRQVNLSRGEVQTLERRLDAALAQVDVVADEIGTIDARMAQVDQRISDATLMSPVAGVVLEAYADEGEYVGPGQPLYDVASLDTLQLRAYVTGAQLSRVGIGRQVTVRYDVGADERATRPGVITWIASEAEFTPTRIQTPEERVDFVYAVEIDVANPDGALKIGMPGEVILREESGRP